MVKAGLAHGYAVANIHCQLFLSIEGQVLVLTNILCAGWVQSEQGIDQESFVLLQYALSSTSGHNRCGLQIESNVPRAFHRR